MKLPDKHTHQLIDRLTQSRLSFALYRLPWTDECYLILQKSEEVEPLQDIMELNGKQGFVLSPFQQTEEHPIVVIRPDVTAYDWDEIVQALSTIENADAILNSEPLSSTPINTLNETERYDRYYAAFRHGASEREEAQETGALPPCFLPDRRIILSAGYLREGMQRLSPNDGLPLPYAYHRHLVGKHSGNHPERKFPFLENGGTGRNTAYCRRSGTDRME